MEAVPGAREALNEFHRAETNLQRVAADYAPGAISQARRGGAEWMQEPLFAAVRAHDLAADRLPTFTRMDVEAWDLPSYEPLGPEYDRRPASGLKLAKEGPKQKELGRLSEIRDKAKSDLAGLAYSGEIAKTEKSERRLREGIAKATSAEIKARLEEGRGEMHDEAARLKHIRAQRTTQLEQAEKDIADLVGTRADPKTGAIAYSDSIPDGVKVVGRAFAARLGGGLALDVKVDTASGMRSSVNNLSGAVREDVARTLREMENNPNERGFVVFSEEQATIVLRDGVPAEEMAVTLGHELGHVLWRSELSRLYRGEGRLSAIGEALWDEYAKVRGRSDAYTDDAAGFEEWYADQLAAHLVADKPKTQDQARREGLAWNVVRHFNELAARLRAWLREVGWRVYGTRLNENELFGRYAEDTLAMYRAGHETRTSRATGLRSTVSRRVEAGFGPGSQARVRKLTTDLHAAGLTKNAGALARKVEQAWRSGSMDGLKSVFVPANAHLREMSQPLADFFAKRSQTGGTVGFHDGVSRRVNRFKNELARTLQVKDPDKPSGWTNEALETALHAAEDETIDNADLAGPALAAREFLQGIYLKYLAIPKETIGYRRNYFPRQLDIAYLHGSTAAREDLADLIRRHAPDKGTRAAAKKIVDGIVSDGEAMSGLNMEGDGRYRPGMASASTRALGFVPTKELRRYSLAQPPLQALAAYIDQAVRRTEFEKRGGSESIQRMLRNVDPKRRAAAERNVKGQLRLLNVGINPGWHRFNTVARAITAWTTLAFSVFGSVGEPLAPMIRGNGIVKLGAFARELGRTVSEEENRELARAVGAVAPEALDTVFGSLGALDDITPAARRSMDFVFRATGLSWITQYTRTLAAGMGREFLIAAAKNPTEPRHRRYLQRLGVTHDQVNWWLEHGRPLDITEIVTAPNAERVYAQEAIDAVKNGISRFVEESSVRPTLGSRPSLGNDPRFALVYDLKSFIYDFGVRHLSGMGRELGVLVKAGEHGHAAWILLLAAGLMLPMAAVALELREGLKWTVRSGLAGVGVDTNPAMAFRSDRMGGTAYMAELMDRSGALGPFSIALSTADAIRWDKNPIVANIPIAEFVTSVAGGDFSRAVPVVSNAL